MNFPKVYRKVNSVYSDKRRSRCAKRKNQKDNGFNVWRSYSDMMAGVLLLFVLIMCVTLFQAQKSYNESLQERDEKIAMQEQYTQELLDKQNTIDEKNETLQNQDEQLKSQDEQLAEQQKQLEALRCKTERTGIDTEVHSRQHLMRRQHS